MLREFSSLKLSVLILCGWCMSVQGAESVPTKSVDPASGFTVWTLKAGKTELKVVPEAGANAYSLKHAGREFLKTPKALKELPGFVYGNPLLYPTPNRVRDSVFTYAGQKYQFPPNDGKNFLHGLVHSARWTVVRADANSDKSALVCELPFAPGSEHYKLFPHQHRLLMQFQVADGKVSLTYTVDNSKGDRPIPFGFAFHPWFLYQGKRENTYLTIPATHHMEAIKVLPTGKLTPLAESPFDARQPRSLKDFVIDDVYFGMTPQKPVVIDHRDVKQKMLLRGTEDFTHLVVYTPKQPWFCVENQTCSTDAHNLAEKGLDREAHLQIVPPGKTHSGSVMIEIKDD